MFRGIPCDHETRIYCLEIWCGCNQRRGRARGVRPKGAEHPPLRREVNPNNPHEGGSIRPFSASLVVSHEGRGQFTSHKPHFVGWNTPERCHADRQGTPCIRVSTVIFWGPSRRSGCRQAGRAQAKPPRPHRVRPYRAPAPRPRHPAAGPGPNWRQKIKGLTQVP
jgi:hypothetical protein